MIPSMSLRNKLLLQQMQQNFGQESLAPSDTAATTNAASVEYKPTTLPQESVSPCSGFPDWSSGNRQPGFGDVEAPLDLSMRGSETSSTRSSQTTERLTTPEETVEQPDWSSVLLAAAAGGHQDPPPIIRDGREQGRRKAQLQPPFSPSDMERMRRRLAKEIFVPLNIVQWDCSYQME